MLLRRIILFFFVALSGCNASGAEYRRIVPQRFTVGTSVFDVRVAGTRAQAIRINPEWAPRLPAVAPRGAAAMEAVSGCRVVRLWGDQVVMEAQLDCGTGPPPLPETQTYECEREPVYRGYADLICSARE